MYAGGKHVNFMQKKKTTVWVQTLDILLHGRKIKTDLLQCVYQEFAGKVKNS